MNTDRIVRGMERRPPSSQLHPPVWRVDQSWSDMPQASHVEEDPPVRSTAAAEFGQAHEDGVSCDSGRRSFAHTWEQLLLLVDEATGKQTSELRDTRFASASLYVLPTPNRFLSSASRLERNRDS